MCTFLMPLNFLGIPSIAAITSSLVGLGSLNPPHPTIANLDKEITCCIQTVTTRGIAHMVKIGIARKRPDRLGIAQKTYSLLAPTC